LSLSIEGIGKKKNHRWSLRSGKVASRFSTCSLGLPTWCRISNRDGSIFRPFVKEGRLAFCNFPPYTWVHPLYKLTKCNFLHTCMMTHHTNPPHLIQGVTPWEHGIHALDLELHVINVLPSSLRYKLNALLLGLYKHCFIPNLLTFMSPTLPCLVCEELKGTKGNLREIASKFH
jgi:hypothetical protein